ncbi:zf-HC2 domain-containing protein [Hufsiella ginkgonis]|uniref:HEAT repeat domain-containing protein n=1 Tax=Hufsiella ginkgonis TaxID=2695274 RepID=A0A7K1Y378_9SPHI|nr:zf-HC2 domain-containing protein [Hufsiella ginkgonis]MXV17753.1 HEAT repeat domain-containing protein [Hufsiella ginkgonis]
MKCAQCEELFTDLVNHELAPAEKEKVERHLAGCPDCTLELVSFKQLWGEMEAVETPVPSAYLKVKFQAMLETYKESVKEEENTAWDTLKEQWKRLWKVQPRWPMAYNLAVILAGFAITWWVAVPQKTGDQGQQLKVLSAQVTELKQTMMLTMLENPSASERMRAVSYTTELKQADAQVIDALLTTLDNDPNVNVRLSTLDALSGMAAYPEVREGLIRSITGQKDPLMQSAIADVMLKLQEKRSVGSLKKLLRQKDLDHGVREKINQTINSLI